MPAPTKNSNLKTMSTDGIFLHLLAREISGELTGFRVDKIHMTSKTEFVFAFRTFDGVKRLFLSCSGANPGMYITGMPQDNPDKPPMLCMLFRKQLVGATLTAIDQAGLDRTLFLRFNAVNEIGDRVARTLVLEVMAQYSNLILLDENDRIIDSVKRVDFSKSSVRQILPGLPYAPPPAQNKLSLLTHTPDEIVSAVLSQNVKLSKAILSVLEGCSPLLARELAYRTDPDDGNTADMTSSEKAALTERLEELSRMIAGEAPVSPNAVIDSDGAPKDYYFMTLTQYGGMQTVPYEKLSALMYEFCRDKETAARMKARAEDLFRLVSSNTERLSRKLSNRLTELEATKDRDQKRIYGEIIYANLHVLGKGAFRYELPDFYHDGKIVEIPAKPELTPAENAERYFKEYRKLKNAEVMLKRLIRENEEELEYLGTVADELDRAQTERETAEIREELIRGGYIRRKGKQPPKRGQKTEFAEFRSPNGFRVAVGRNNLQNDELSHKNAGRHDIWFHVQKAPGSHVILFTEGRQPEAADMEFAAGLAVLYSSKKSGGTAEVDYTEAGNLKKPGGSRPGFVIYHVYNSIQGNVKDAGQG